MTDTPEGKPQFEPCPKCSEKENIGSELHPGTSYIRCYSCGHTGPELWPRPDPDGKHSPAAVWAEWNASSKAQRGLT